MQDIEIGLNQRFTETVETLYSAISASDKWPIFLEKFCGLMNFAQASFTIHYPDGKGFDARATYGVSDNDLLIYQRYVKDDPWTSGDIVRTTPLGVVVPSNSICPDEQLEKLDVYKDFLGPRGWHYGGGVVLARNHHQFAVLSGSRSKALGPLKDSEIEVWNQIVPHLRRAVELQDDISTLQMERDAMLEYLDMLPKPVFLLNGRASIMLANTAADVLIREKSGIKRVDGRLEFESETTHNRFLKALQIVSPGFSPVGHEDIRIDRFVDPSNPRQLIVVSRIGSDEARIGVFVPTVAVYVFKMETDSIVDSQGLQSLFGLTNSETTLVQILVKGNSLDEAAVRMQISKNTVRTHLQNVLKKSGCTRQAELVALVLRICG